MGLDSGVQINISSSVLGLNPGQIIETVAVIKTFLFFFFLLLCGKNLRGLFVLAALVRSRTVGNFNARFVTPEKKGNVFFWGCVNTLTD